MLLEVVDSGDRDLDRLATEALDAVPWHREVPDIVGHGPHREIRRKVEGCGIGVAVKDHVQVLVERDAGEELLREGILGRGAGIPVRDPGGELLE